MLELSSTTRIKVFNGIGNNIDPFHKSSRHIHSHFTVHLHRVRAFSPLAIGPPVNGPPAKSPLAIRPPPAAIRPPVDCNYILSYSLPLFIH